MQNLVQQNPFTKYKFITKTWKDYLRKGKKDKRRPAGRRGRKKTRAEEEEGAEHPEARSSPASGIRCVTSPQKKHAVPGSPHPLSRSKKGKRLPGKGT